VSEIREPPAGPLPSLTVIKMLINPLLSTNITRVLEFCSMLYVTDLPHARTQQINSTSV
jgi:hypothetical protein